jgi:hypothetical protein
LERLAQYIARPNQREAWKRWLEIESSGVSFLNGFAAVFEVAGKKAPIRLRAVHMDEVISRFDVHGSVSQLASKLIKTASRVSGHYLASADSELDPNASG